MLPIDTLLGCPFVRPVLGVGLNDAPLQVPITSVSWPSGLGTG
ncbi:hypothetical protein ACE2AJ_09525 [Aquihabitans daechungensis]